MLNNNKMKSTSKLHPQFKCFNRMHIMLINFDIYLTFL